MKKTIIGLFIFFSLLVASVPCAHASFFDMVVESSWDSNTHFYQYTLSYPSYTYNPSDMRGISHWWLEVNCSHASIDEDSIYGYSIIDGQQYDWDPEFGQNLGQVGDYDDWVIKWETPEDIEIDKTAGTVIGYFGFYSSQPPVTGNWGGKGGTYFSNGTTQRPMSQHGNTTPEPTTLALFGISLFGFKIFKRREVK